MSKKSTACPLLIRHRYLNPFPPPPFPPKLLHIPTDPTRYAGYRFLTNLEAERQPTILVDNDLGMPIELGLESDGTYGLGTYWEGDRNVICPDSKQVALDPEDLALLVDPAPVQGSSISIINASGQNQAVSSTSTTIPGSVPRSTDRRKVEVSWLRRTEYFNETQNKSRDSLTSKSKSQTNLLTNTNTPSSSSHPPQPKTKEDRLADIHQSFNEIHQQPFQSLRHPTKPHLKPIEAFDWMPNPNLWANTSDFYRFPEIPNDDRKQPKAVVEEEDEIRYDHAILRPVPPIHADSRLAYYVPKSIKTVQAYKRQKLGTKTIDEGVPDLPLPESHPTHQLNFVREYEVAQRRMMNQYLLLFDDGTEAGHHKAAYFSPVAQFCTLRKRRPAGYGQQSGLDDLGQPLWDGIQVALAEDEESIEVARAPRNELLDGLREPPKDL